MALPSYLTRRDGRYYLQIRFSRPLAQLSGVSLYRVSLRTGDYRKARQKLTEFLSWILRMNESINFVDLFQKNVVELRQYLSDQLPISEERLHARLHYEEMLKNLRRRALARDCDPEMIAPEFTILFKRFVAQNVEAEGWLRRIENIRHYEQGRADMQTAIALGVIPQGFGMGLGQPPAGVPSIPLPTPFSTVMPSNPLGVPGVELHAAASPKDEDRAAPVWEERTQEQDSGPQQAQEPVSQTTALRFSEALALFEEDDIRNGGNADARALVLLVVQFIIDKMDDPLLVEFDKEAAARIDAMLPDIPDRKNIPREHTVSLAARYDYARKHGWAGLKRLTEARLKNGYHNALSRFVGWLIEQKLYPFEKPKAQSLASSNNFAISLRAAQSQLSAPPLWYSITRVSKKFFSSLRSIASDIQGNGCRRIKTLKSSHPTSSSASNGFHSPDPSRPTHVIKSRDQTLRISASGRCGCFRQFPQSGFPG